MNTELKNAVQAADKKAQYDESAKRLLGQKSILAHILVKCVEEFKGMDPKDIVPLIEGTPYIGCVPVEPGLTNVGKSAKGNPDRIPDLKPSNLLCEPPDLFPEREGF